jgi:hypothetical protein
LAKEKNSGLSRRKGEEFPNALTINSISDN